MSSLPGMLFALAVSFIASADALAEKLKPPSLILGESTTSIVVADYKEAGPANRIVFVKVEVLQSRADVPELIDLGQPDLFHPLIVGKRYVLAYSPYAEDRLERIVVNSRGAQFVSSPGIEPALFIDSAEIRSLVMWRIDGEDSEGESGNDIDSGSERADSAAERAMPRLLKMLRSQDRQQQDFAAAEIAYRPKLLSKLDASEQKALQRFVASDAGLDRARAALLHVAASMPSAAAAVRGWNGVVTDLLGNTSVKTLGVGRRSSLILAALAYPPTRQHKRDGSLQARWLRSDDLALVEAAVTALQEMSVDLAKAEVDAALAESTLPTDNRLLLDGFQQRLELMTTLPGNTKQ